MAIVLRVTGTGTLGASMYVTDVYPNRYIANAGTEDFNYTSDVARSFETGALSIWIAQGHLTTAVVLGATFEDAVAVTTENAGVAVETETRTINFVGAGVTAAAVGANQVDVTIPGGGGGGGMTSIDFGTTGLTPAVATGGVVAVAGTLAVGSGGTGITTAPKGTVLVANALDTISALAGAADRDLPTYTAGTDDITMRSMSTGSSGLAYGAVGGATMLTFTRNTAGVPPQYATGDNTAVLFQDWGGTGQDLSGSVLTPLTGLLPNVQLAGRITTNTTTTSTSGTPLLYNLLPGDVAPAGGTGLTLAIFGAGANVTSVVATPVPDNFNTGTGYNSGDVITIPQADIPGSGNDLIITLVDADFTGNGVQGVFMGGYNSGGVIADMGRGSIVSLDGSVSVVGENGMSNRSEGSVQLQTVSAPALHISYVAGETLAVGDVLKFGLNASGETAGRAYHAQADTLANSGVVAVARSAGITAGSVSCVVAGEASMTFDVVPAANDNGKPVYLSATAAQATLTAPAGGGTFTTEIGRLTGGDGASNPVTVLLSVRPTVSN